MTRSVVLDMIATPDNRSKCVSGIPVNTLPATPAKYLMKASGTNQ